MDSNYGNMEPYYHSTQGHTWLLS